MIGADAAGLGKPIVVFAEPVSGGVATSTPDRWLGVEALSVVAASTDVASPDVVSNALASP